MKAYKGFNKDLRCRDFQYEVGKEYEENRAELCECGFHACENPIDVFNYYPPANSRYCEVELDEVTDNESSDSKRCGKRIKINAEIGIKGIVDAFVKFTMDRVDWKKDKSTNTGNRSAATNTGYQSAAINTGNWSAAINTSDWSAATVEGKESIAIATGIGGKAKGALGCYIVLAEWKRDELGEWRIIDVKSVKVDGENIKGDTFYILKNGKFKEAEE